MLWDGGVGGNENENLAGGVVGQDLTQRNKLSNDGILSTRQGRCLAECIGKWEESGSQVS